MTIVVYWGCSQVEWLRAKSPEPIYKDFLKNIKNANTNIQFCPSVKDYMNNTFAVKSLYDYGFHISEDKKFVNATHYTQKFFDEHVEIRSIPEKFFSFPQRFVFFTEEKSLNMSAGISPFLEDNNITKRCITIPGTLDIGRWFRELDFAFYLKKEYNDFKIDEEEIFQYIKFDTKEKIVFKQFRFNEKINQYSTDIIKAKHNRTMQLRALETYYSMLNHKKQIIKEIKKNLVD
jgi:hypothetical protein